MTSLSQMRIVLYYHTLYYLQIHWSKETSGNIYFKYVHMMRMFQLLKEEERWRGSNICTLCIKFALSKIKITNKLG